MFGKVKKILGIEGVKAELSLSEPFDKKSQKIQGVVKLSTKTNSSIESITVRLIEKYARGRKRSRLIDEYVLGELIMTEKIDITSDEIIEVPFELEFVNLRSDVDKMSDGNVLLRGPLLLAKYLKNVSSDYRLEAQVLVAGTKLQPFAEINL